MGKNTTGNLGMLQIPATNVRNQPLVPGTPEYEAALATQRAKQDAMRRQFVEVQPGAPGMTQEQAEAWQAQQQARADNELAEILKQIHGGNEGERQLTPVEGTPNATG